MPFMTAVFEVQQETWNKNPFDVETPFGRAVAVANGDLTEKIDKAELEIDRLRGLLYQLKFSFKNDLLSGSVIGDHTGMWPLADFFACNRVSPDDE